MQRSVSAAMATLVVVASTYAVEARPRGSFSGRSTASSAPATAPGGVGQGPRGPTFLYLGGGRSTATAATAATAAGAVVGASAASATGGPEAPPKPAAQKRAAQDPCAAHKTFGQGAGFCAVN